MEYEKLTVTCPQCGEELTVGKDWGEEEFVECSGCSENLIIELTSNGYEVYLDI